MNLARFFGFARNEPAAGRTQIIDLDKARVGIDAHLPLASVEAAVGSLKRFGVVIIRNAFEPSRLSGLFENAIEHGKYVEAIARAGGEYSFTPNYAWGPSSLACDVTALDPATRQAEKPDISETTLWQELVSPLVRGILRAAVGTEASWTMARARVVVPGVRTGNPSGKLPLHLEKLAFKFPGIHNLWTPLVAPGLITNVDTAGLQFYIGQLATFENLNPETEKAVMDEISLLGPGVDMQEAPADAKGFFYRPKLGAGDVAIFSGSIPHAGFVPAGVTLSRVGCDIRVFPRTDLQGARPLEI